MDLDVIDRFVAITEHGSYRAAAAALYISQPTLSRQIRQLEEELGAQLFERGRWGMRLTEEGERLLPVARRLIADVGGLRNVVRQDGQLVVRLGAASTAIGSFLAPFLTQWARDHARIRLELIEDGSIGLRTRLTRGECDIALLAPPIPEGFPSRPVKTFSLRAHIARGHPLAEEDGPLSLADVAAHPLLINAASFVAADVLEAAFKLEGLEPDIVYESLSGHTLAALAENGGGIAIIADTVDLRGYDLLERPLVLADGHGIEFVLHLAWRSTFTDRLEFADFVEQFVTWIVSRRRHVGGAPAGAGLGPADGGRVSRNRSLAS
jgi:DNA-binding transcriptional LysR family regulator